jgi:hypothetical protein
MHLPKFFISPLPTTHHQIELCALLGRKALKANNCLGIFEFEGLSHVGGPENFLKLSAPYPLR